MKKLLTAIFCKTVHTSTPVEDVKTHRKEIATSYQILGFPYKTTYSDLSK